LQLLLYFNELLLLHLDFFFVARGNYFLDISQAVLELFATGFSGFHLHSEHVILTIFVIVHEGLHVLHFALQVVHITLYFIALRAVLFQLVHKGLTDLFAVLDLLLKHSVLFVLELVLSTFLGVLLVFEEVLVLLIQPLLRHLLLLELLTLTLKSSLLCIVDFNIFIIQIGSFFVNLYVFTF